MSEFTVGLRGVSDADRRRSADHLRESARLMNRPLEVMDELMFRMKPGEAKFDTPVTKAVAAVAEALGRPGAVVKVPLPNLSKQDVYVLSELFARSASRAAGNWMDPSSPAAEVIERLRAEWDRQFRVTGDPGDRAHMRSRVPWMTKAERARAMDRRPARQAGRAGDAG